MAYNKTYSEIRAMLKASKRISKQTMLKIAKMAIKETLMDRIKDEDGNEIEVTWDSKLGDDLMLDSLDMVELVMFLEECFGVEIPDEMAGDIVTVGDAIEVIKKAKANKGKKPSKKALKAKYLKKTTSSPTKVPHPDSPFMKNPPGKGLGTGVTSSEELDKALEEEDGNSEPVS